MLPHPLPFTHSYLLNSLVITVERKNIFLRASLSAERKGRSAKSTKWIIKFCGKLNSVVMSLKKAKDGSEGEREKERTS